MLPRRESDVSVFTQTPVSDYEKLCGTDILGLEENHYNHDEFVFEKFKNNWIEAKRAGMRQGSFGGKTNTPGK